MADHYAMTSSSPNEVTNIRRSFWTAADPSGLQNQSYLTCSSPQPVSLNTTLRKPKNPYS